MSHPNRVLDTSLLSPTGVRELSIIKKIYPQTLPLIIMEVAAHHQAKPKVSVEKRLAQDYKQETRTYIYVNILLSCGSRAASGVSVSIIGFLGEARAKFAEKSSISVVLRGRCK